MIFRTELNKLPMPGMKVLNDIIVTVPGILQSVKTIVSIFQKLPPFEETEL